MENKLFYKKILLFLQKTFLNINYFSKINEDLETMDKMTNPIELI